MGEVVLQSNAEAEFTHKPLNILNSLTKWTAKVYHPELPIDALLNLYLLCRY